MRIPTRVSRALLAFAVGAAGVTAVATVAAPGAQAAAATVRGAYVPLNPKTVLDTRTGASKNHKGAIGAKHYATFGIRGHGGVPASAGAVLLKITAVTPKGTGSLVAYNAGQARPAVATLQFSAGKQAIGTAYVQLSGSGYIRIFNNGSRAQHVSAVVVGYYTDGTVNAPGSVVPVKPARLVNVAAKANKQVAAKITGRDGIPAGASAVVGVLTAAAPARAGSAVAWQPGAARPTAPSLRFAKGANSASLAVVPLSSSGSIELRNTSTGTTRLIFDAVAYVVAGGPARTGATGTVRALTAYQGVVGAGRKVTPQVTGHGGVPTKNVRTVTVIVTVSGPKRSGTVLAYKSGGGSSGSTAEQFFAGRTASTLMTVPVSATGRIALVNRSTGKATLGVAVVGYTLSSSLVAPKVSVSHYVRTTADLRALGQSDAKQGVTLVVLHIGAQLNNATGVTYSATSTTRTYAQLVTQLQSYLSGLGNRSATVAIATNNDANNWTSYTATARGTGWATQVVNKLRGGSGVRVVGANDIEWGFYSTAQQALAWEAAYLKAATTKELVFVGSADGCPTAFGSNASCNWTLAQQYQLAGGKDTRIKALPQIYTWAQAKQWANIDRAGGRRISFLGALTEHAAAPSSSGTPQQAYPELWNELAAIGVTPPAVVTDLRIN